MRANERTYERVAQYLRLYSCLFQTTVPWWAPGGPALDGDAAAHPAMSASVLIMTPQGLVPAPVPAVGAASGSFLPPAISAPPSSSSAVSQALTPYVGGAAFSRPSAPSSLLTPGPTSSPAGPPWPQPAPPTGAGAQLDSQLAPILVSENRQQNTEVRMSIDKVLTKIEEMKTAVAALDLKVSALHGAAPDVGCPSTWGASCPRHRLRSLAQ